LWGNFHQVDLSFSGDAQRFLNRHDANLGTFFIDQTNLGRQNLLIDTMLILTADCSSSLS